MASSSAPSNDDISNATALRIGGSTLLPGLVDASGATTNPGEPTSFTDTTTGALNVQTNKSVWYSYAPVQDGTANFNTAFSNYDTTVAVYQLSDPTQPASYSNLTQVAGNNDTPGRTTSEVVYPVTAGQQYYIQVGAAGTSDPGTLQFGYGGPPTVGVCYVSGTLIRTTHGDVAVEDLRVGDFAITSSKEVRRIRWLGHRTVSCRGLEGLLPVRIAAGALGEGRPERDLLVSPGHSICLDVLGEVMIPASALVNGVTITQEQVAVVTYWHVELDSHDILIANGQPAESYLDMGNRSFFVVGSVIGLLARPDADPATRTHADFCRPFHGEGPLVDAVRVQLQRRADALVGSGERRYG